MGPPLSFLQVLPAANISLWNILIMVQLFTIIAIPITRLLIIQPQLTVILCNIILWLDIYFFLSVASLSTTKTTVVQSKEIYSHLALIVATLGLIVTLLAVYELMLIM